MEAAASTLFGSGSQQRLLTADAWRAVGITDTLCGLHPPMPDTTLPETTITSAPLATTSSTSASFSFTSSEANSTFECSLDSVAFSTCTSPQTYKSLSLGPHNFQVYRGR